MLDVVKAVPEDFDRVYPLLLEFNNPSITRESWKLIFDPPWDTGEDYCGYMLLDGDEVVGYFGYLFGRNTIGGREVRFFNLTSWIVREEYRNHSLDLFYPGMNLKEYVKTDFSPADNVFRMLVKRYKFRLLDQAVTFAYPAPGRTRTACRIHFDDDIPDSIMHENDARIYHDHKTLKVRHILVVTDDGYCYIAGMNRRFRKIRHLELYYISNPAVMASCAGRVIQSICRRYLVFGIMVENRLLRGHSLPFSRARKPVQTTLYQANFDIDPADITKMYSEKVMK